MFIEGRKVDPRSNLINMTSEKVAREDLNQPSAENIEEFPGAKPREFLPLRPQARAEKPKRPSQFEEVGYNRPDVWLTPDKKEQKRKYKIKRDLTKEEYEERVAKENIYINGDIPPTTPNLDSSMTDLALQGLVPDGSSSGCTAELSESEVIELDDAEIDATEKIAEIPKATDLIPEEEKTEEEEIDTIEKSAETEIIPEPTDPIPEEEEAQEEKPEEEEAEEGAPMDEKTEEETPMEEKAKGEEADEEPANEEKPMEEEVEEEKAEEEKAKKEKGKKKKGKKEKVKKEKTKKEKTKKERKKSIKKRRSSSKKPQSQSGENEKKNESVSGETTDIKLESESTLPVELLKPNLSEDNNASTSLDDALDHAEISATEKMAEMPKATDPISEEEKAEEEEVSTVEKNAEGDLPESTEPISEEEKAEEEKVKQEKATKEQKKTTKKRRSSTKKQYSESSENESLMAPQKSQQKKKPLVNLRHILQKHEKKASPLPVQEVGFYGSMSAIPFLKKNQPQQKKEKSKGEEKKEKSKGEEEEEEKTNVMPLDNESVGDDPKNQEETQVDDPENQEETQVDEPVELPANAERRSIAFTGADGKEKQVEITIFKDYNEEQLQLWKSMSAIDDDIAVEKPVQVLPLLPEARPNMPAKKRPSNSIVGHNRPEEWLNPDMKEIGKMTYKTKEDVERDDVPPSEPEKGVTTV